MLSKNEFYPGVPLVALYNCFLLVLSQDIMLSVTCEAGIAHYYEAPDFTLQLRVYVVPFYIYWFCQCPDKCFVGQP